MAPKGLLILGGSKSKDEDEDTDETEDKGESLTSMGRKKAAKAVLAAIESSDAGALDTALADHAYACESEGSEEDDE